MWGPQARENGEERRANLFPLPAERNEEMPPPGAQPAPKRKRRQTGIEEAVQNAMHQRIGLHTTVSEMHSQIADQFDPPLTRQQINTAMHHLVSKGVLHRVMQGTYLYNPTATPTASGKAEAIPPSETSLHIYEGIGYLRDGTIIVRSDDGYLYSLHELGSVTQS